MPAEGIVVIADYNEKSELLQRAFDRALRAEREIRFCRISDTDFVPPAEKDWIVPRPR